MLLAAREFLERALSTARSRQDERIIGERIVDVMVLEELQECRTLAEVKLLGCKHTSCDHWRRSHKNADGYAVVASDCTECGQLVFRTMPPDWDGTVYVFTRGDRPQRLVI